ncbi:MAG: hypothetical protein R3C56_00125 [Pirellulaceae bacterium]
MIQQVVFESELQNRFETGLVTSEQFAAEVNTELESALPAVDILEAISAIFEPNLEILAAIDLVKSSGVPMGILSNTCEAHWHWILDKQWPMFGPWWSQTVLSYKVQGMKQRAKSTRFANSVQVAVASRSFYRRSRPTTSPPQGNVAGAPISSPLPTHSSSRLQAWL